MNRAEQLTIGELAKRARVNLETIRYYERQELLLKPPRLQSGYRSFPEESVGRIRFIKQAQKVGFSLKEIKELLMLQAEPHSVAADLGERVEAKIAHIEEKLRTLRTIKKDLIQLIKSRSGQDSWENYSPFSNLQVQSERSDNKRLVNK